MNSELKYRMAPPTVNSILEKSNLMYGPILDSTQQCIEVSEYSLALARKRSGKGKDIKETLDKAENDLDLIKNMVYLIKGYIYHMKECLLNMLINVESYRVETKDPDKFINRVTDVYTGELEVCKLAENAAHSLFVLTSRGKNTDRWDELPKNEYQAIWKVLYNDVLRLIEEIDREKNSIL